MSDFDSEAREWDKKQKHIDRSEAIAKKLLEACKLNNHMKALEYGAGTGLLSFILKDKFLSITLMDSSAEMVRVTKEKIQESASKHMKALFFDLEENDYIAEKFDIIFTQMVLHHVNDVQKILNKFYELLNPDGIVAIADLYSEDGHFHSGEFTGHHGFDPDKLTDKLQALGFQNLQHEECFVIEKENEDGNSKPYPVFLLVGYKKY